MFEGSRDPSSSAGKLTLRRPSDDPGDELTEESDVLRSAFSFGPSGMLGVVYSPKNLWLWVEYF